MVVSTLESYAAEYAQGFKDEGTAVATQDGPMPTFHNRFLKHCSDLWYLSALTYYWPWVNTPCCRGAPPPLCYKPLSRRLCFKPLSRGIAGAPPILLTGMLRNSKQADTLRFHEGECAKYRKKMRVQQAVNPEASIVQERGLGFKV